MIPTSPTSSLPPLVHLSRHSLKLISLSLLNLRSLYFPPPSPILRILPDRRLKSRTDDPLVPDSGYASAEEDDANEDEEQDSNVLSWDPFERAFAIKWLIGFTARSEIWLAAAPSDLADNQDARSKAIDDAASLLSAFSGDLEPESAITRVFSFRCDLGCLQIELNDAPLSSTDHTSVGLQSWASSIVLAERICLNPQSFNVGSDSSRLRILELGAGTGLLSIVVSKLVPNSVIMATDYHADVLSNLRSNISHNSRFAVSSSISVHLLDWSQPTELSPFDTTFDIILAADVIYHPMHAQWIKSCIEMYLGPTPGSVFWLIIPLRSTGRHEGMGDTVDEVFHTVGDCRRRQLTVLSKEEIGKKDGIGRVDERSYLLYKIGWLDMGCSFLTS